MIVFKMLGRIVLNILTGIQYEQCAVIAASLREYSRDVIPYIKSHSGCEHKGMIIRMVYGITRLKPLFKRQITDVFSDSWCVRGIISLVNKRVCDITILKNKGNITFFIEIRQGAFLWQRATFIL